MTEPRSATKALGRSTSRGCCDGCRPRTATEAPKGTASDLRHGVPGRVAGRTVTTMAQEQITREGLDEQGLTQWQLSAAGLVTTYVCGSFTAAGEFAAQVAAIADQRNHHPDLSLSYPGHVRITTLSHDVGRLTGRDIGLATAVAELAAKLGFEPAADAD